MTELMMAIAWLVLGSVWAYIFINHVLDDQRWGDTGRKPGVFNILMIIAGAPIMAPLVAVAYTHDALKNRAKDEPNVIQRFFGIKEL